MEVVVVVVLKKEQVICPKLMMISRINIYKESRGEWQLGYTAAHLWQKRQLSRDGNFNCNAQQFYLLLQIDCNLYATHQCAVCFSFYF